MSAQIERLPPRRAAVIWLLRETSGGWLVLAREHGWLHGEYDDALDDARWLARNLGLPIRLRAAA